jgi:selenocysteine lyase/cysteine desulfurase
MEHLKELLDDTVKIVSLQYASNVTGAVHPLEKVRDIIGKDRLFFIDATQMAIHGPMNMRALSADAMVFSGHKMMADTGIGVLALWRVLQKAWDAPIGGGGAINFVSETTHEQAGIPEKWEPGTPHITGAVSISAAINVLSSMSEDVHLKYKELISYTNKCLQSFTSDQIKIFHSDTPNALGIWSFTITGKHGNDIAEALSEYGICVRSGHHCCSPLHTSWGTSGTVRISIGYQTTQEEIDYFFSKLRELI